MPRPNTTRATVGKNCRHCFVFSLDCNGQVLTLRKGGDERPVTLTRFRSALAEVYMRKPFRVGVRSVASDLAILFSALGVAGSCMFGAKVTETDPSGTGGSVDVMRTGGKGGGAATASGGSGTGGAPSLTKDAGTCIRDPGQDTCMSVCKIESHLPDRLPPDILIVLDKSGSMAESVSNKMGCNLPGCQNKWVQVTGAINTVVAATDTTVSWGLKYFATDDQCGVTAGAEVPIAVANHAPIMASIQATTPTSRTPTHAGVNAAVEYLKTLKDAAPKYIVLATDGSPIVGPTRRWEPGAQGAGSLAERERPRTTLPPSRRSPTRSPRGIPRSSWGSPRRGPPQKPR